MYMKAILFGDKATGQKILNAKNPKDAKDLGRQVRGFSAPVWKKKCLQIVVDGNLLKFRQHENLRKELLKTGDKVLVEASPMDKIWGIGLSSNDPKAKDPKQWQGENLLGKALIQVRERLAKEESQSK